MIAMVKTGKSFSHCISYCLEDKRELSQEQKLNLVNKDGLQHLNRAEVLFYNQCFGNKKELAGQFKDVSKLSKRVEKPVLHVAIRLAPGETLSKQEWIEVSQKAAQGLGVDNNQYLVIQHRDTKEEHIHIVANRVGFDGRAASTSNNFYKMDTLLRSLEKDYNLQKVLSPKQFLPKQQQQLPRVDLRKEKMREAIKASLKRSHDYHDFEKHMKELGYQTIKGRGISFIDDKKMKVKGSDLGYSLMTIEKELSQKLQKRLSVENVHQQSNQQFYSPKIQIHIHNRSSFLKSVKENVAGSLHLGKELSHEARRFQKNFSIAILDTIIRQEPINSEMHREANRNTFKKKKKDRGLYI